MSVFGLEAGQVRHLVTDVSPGVELDDNDVADRFARAAWSVIAEPGDGTAGALVAQLGAAEALRFVLLEQSRADAPDRSVQPSGSVAGAKPVIAAVGSNAVADDPRTQGDVRAGAAQNATATAPQPGAEPSRLATGQGPNGELAAGIERWRPRLRSSAVERVLHLAARIGATLIVPGRLCEQPLPWPTGVDDLGAHAPIALWARGSVGRRLSRNPPGVALVGARAATGYGEHVASELSAGLVELGLPIVSGAAYGIDGMAHRAALASGGLTLAFLAGGVDRFYPAGHDDLLRRITEHGLVLSEVPCGTAPT